MSRTAIRDAVWLAVDDGHLVLVGAFDIGGAVLFRQGVTIETQSTGTDWTANMSRFRAEERLAPAIYRPAAFCKGTLL